MKIPKQGKGWRQESMRHSNARKFRKAGPPYSKGNPKPEVVYDRERELRMKKGLTPAEEIEKGKLEARIWAAKKRELKKLGKAEEIIEQRKREEEKRKVMAGVLVKRREAERERVLLPMRHKQKKRTLSEEYKEAHSRGDTGDMQDIRSKIVKLEHKEPKMFIKGAKRLAKLEKKQAKTAKLRQKVDAQRLKKLKALPRKQRIAKIKRFIKIPDAVARAEAITAKALPMAGESEEKVEPKFRPII